MATTAGAEPHVSGSAARLPDPPAARIAVPDPTHAPDTAQCGVTPRNGRNRTLRARESLEACWSDQETPPRTHRSKVPSPWRTISSVPRSAPLLIFASRVDLLDE